MKRSNIQDGTIIHSTGGLSTTHVGKRCTIGHRVLLHGCTIEDDCLIGMGAIILDNSTIGTGSIVGAGALVTANTVVPPNSLVLGMPAKVVKTITADEQAKWIGHGHEEYLNSWRKSGNGGEIMNGKVSNNRHQRPGCFLTMIGIVVGLCSLIG